EADVHFLRLLRHDGLFINGRGRDGAKKTRPARRRPIFVRISKSQSKGAVMGRRMGGVSLRPFERFVAAIAELIVLQPCLAFAQTATGTIVGVVKDTSGALIPGVSIAVKHTDTGQTRTAISSDSGSYNVPLLPVGAYEL